MNGLYGMPETAIEDADHTTSDDLTSKINYIEKSPGKYPWLFQLCIHFLSLFTLSRKFPWPKAKRPKTTVIAGTSNGLTINVSSNTPIAVTIPN